MLSDKWSEGILLNEVMDFPRTISYGSSLAVVRNRLASALRDMAECSFAKVKGIKLKVTFLRDRKSVV